MKRRQFLKLLTVAPLAPSVLAGKGTKPTIPYDGSSSTGTVGVPDVGWTYLISTPTGTNHYYDMWKESEQYFLGVQGYQWLHFQVEQ